MVMLLFVLEGTLGRTLARLLSCLSCDVETFSHLLLLLVTTCVVPNSFVRPKIVNLNNYFFKI
jgi:hypothetical protein